MYDDRGVDITGNPGTDEAVEDPHGDELDCAHMRDREFISKMFTGDLLAVSAAVGVEATLRIMLAFGGGNLYIPLPQEMVRTLRDENLRRMHASGRSARDLSRIFRLTERMVYNILRSPAVGISPALERSLNSIIHSADAGKAEDPQV